MVGHLLSRCLIGCLVHVLPKLVDAVIRQQNFDFLSFFLFQTWVQILFSFYFSGPSPLKVAFSATNFFLSRTEETTLILGGKKVHLCFMRVCCCCFCGHFSFITCETHREKLTWIFIFILFTWLPLGIYILFLFFIFLFFFFPFRSF